MTTKSLTRLATLNDQGKTADMKARQPAFPFVLTDSHLFARSSFERFATVPLAATSPNFLLEYRRNYILFRPPGFCRRYHIPSSDRIHFFVAIIGNLGPLLRRCYL